MDDAVAESVLVEELEIGARVGRQCGVAPTEDDWPDEQGSSSTSPATRACAARFGPPTKDPYWRRPSGRVPRSGSKWRSSRVFAVGGAARVEE